MRRRRGLPFAVRLRSELTPLIPFRLLGSLFLHSRFTHTSSFSSLIQLCTVRPWPSQTLFLASSTCLMRTDAVVSLFVNHSFPFLTVPLFILLQPPFCFLSMFHSFVSPLLILCDR